LALAKKQQIMKDPRPVTQCDLEGNPIERFPSISAACKALGVVDATIRKAVANNKIVLDKYRFHFDIVTDPAERERITKERDTSHALPSFSTMPLLPMDAIPAAHDPEKFFTEIMESVTPQLIEEKSQSIPPDRWMTPYERILARRK
jgi:hypothetical protein